MLKQIIGIKQWILTIFAVLLAMPSWADKKSETIIYMIKEPVFGETQVPVEIAVPLGQSNSLPLIISQHGSTRDGHNFEGRKGKTDEYSRRLMKAAVQRGYAVASIDAFYKKGISPSSKTKFPTASRYGLHVAKALAKDPRFDAHNIFYTGFSFGGSQVNRLLKSTVTPNGFDFAGLASAEPGCNAFLEPKNYPVPLLLLKGGESHYQLKPCQIMVDLYREAGMSVDLKVFPKSNHFFSHNGQVVRGKAVNGCPDNPVIIKKDGRYWLNGGKVSKKEFRKKCITNTGGKGKSREDLDDAVMAVIDFFDNHRR